MACLGLVLFCLACFAGDVVELEPVRALSFRCNLLTSGGIVGCQQNPFCYWAAPNCVDDPCLVASNRVLELMTDTCENIVGSSTCHQRDVSADVLDRDCTGATINTGFLCVTTSLPPGGLNDRPFDYCAYALIRDQKCPDSICHTNSTTVGCIPNNVGECTMLSTETECGRIPKCYWSSSTCLADPCWATGPIVSPNTCEGLSISVQGAAAATNQCKLFQPWVSGEQKDYCVHKSQSNPNICYFGTPGATTSNTSTDYGTAFPKYNAYTDSGSPTCTGSAPNCSGGECYTTINTGGAFAGQYCTDGTHGNANILRIPSMLVFLVVSALSLFIL